jgi:hypothetical protein
VKRDDLAAADVLGVFEPRRIVALKFLSPKGVWKDIEIRTPI